MPSSEARELSNSLTEMNERFARELPARTREIVNLWSQARKAPPSEPKGSKLWSLLVSRIHYLSGTGDTFGRPEVSRAAGEMERILIDRLSRRQAPEPKESRRIGELLTKLPQD